MTAIVPIVADPERRKLFASLGMNMLTRVPSLLLVLVLLPRIFAGLGENGYAALFAALAVGTLGIFLMGGASVLGMRRIGAAASEGDRRAEATAFVSLAIANGVLTSSLMVAVIVAELAQGQSLDITCVAMLPLLQAGLNTTFDNARLAYNEHYRTAALGVMFQILWYGLALAIPALTTHLLLAATIFHAPVVLASLSNGLLLLRERPYLLDGRPRQFAAMIRAAFSFGLAEGTLGAGLALMLVWFETRAPAATTAWYATQVRLFQMCLTPLLMVMVPLGSFVRLKWTHAAPHRRREALLIALLVGIVAFLGASIGLGVIGPIYAGGWIGLRAPAPWFELAPLFLLFGAIAFYRCFAAVALLVLEGERLALRIAGANVGAGLLWLAAAPVVAPIDAFAIFAAAASVSMLGVLVGSARSGMAALRPARDDAAVAEILGVPITLTDHHDACERVLGWVQARRTAYVCVRDVHGVMLAQRDPELMAIHHRAPMVLPDGMPLVHVARMRGYAHIQRVAGPDFVETLADRGRARGVRHFFYGGAPGVAERMAAVLRARYPGLVVAGCLSPPFGELDDTTQHAELAEINAATPDVVWVGLGTPKQERWMNRFHGAIPGATLIGVGAAFDFHAGTRRRAPRWMQRATLEWLHRLLSEPGRLWRRYLVIAPQFVWRVLLERAP
jgi:N-acetylglucosaminyldiphosphoundecaprenol N-acetyl-beta-D-mannosaminyltransferase